MSDSTAPTTGEVLEFLDWMGMDEEADELRADVSQVDCARRVLRICQLAGLPISTHDSPGVVIAPVREPDAVSQAYLGTGVRVSWQVSPELDQAGVNASPGEASDLLVQTVAAGMEAMLASVLERGGCRTVRDSLVGDLVVRLVSSREQTDELYLDDGDEEAS